MNRKLITLLMILVIIPVIGLAATGCLVETGTQIGEQAPGFQLQNLDGETVSLRDFRGSPVLVNFWATWCGPCRYEMPFIQEIYEDEEWQNTGLVILAINLRESVSLVEEFMQSNNYSFTVLFDTDSGVAIEYDVIGIPTTFLIDKDGTIQEKRVGPFSSKADIENALGAIIP